MRMKYKNKRKIMNNKYDKFNRIITIIINL